VDPWASAVGAALWALAAFIAVHLFVAGLWALVAGLRIAIGSVAPQQTLPVLNHATFSLGVGGMAALTAAALALGAAS
jgi:cytochrome c oxidase subunit I+III